jgi:uncharacterized protein with PIN domain
MRRIAKGYRARFCALLRTVRARKLDQALAWLGAQAERIRSTEQVPAEVALMRVVERVRRRLEPWQARLEASSGANGSPGMPQFICDAGLGGLARWLRAAGYPAIWRPQWDDAALLEEARRTGATLLTTDSLLMERRLLRDGVIPALWLPPTLRPAGQLQQVLRQLRLPLRPARCMSCGGALRPADKQAVQDRIPPRTYRWRDHYFECEDCGKLFWHGTHWERIQQQLKTVVLTQGS